VDFSELLESRDVVGGLRDIGAAGHSSQVARPQALAALRLAEVLGDCGRHGRKWNSLKVNQNRRALAPARGD
jgi:hypothetical protein